MLSCQQLGHGACFILEEIGRYTENCFILEKKAAAEKQREDAAAERADVRSVELLQECAACRTRAADASRCA